MLELANKLPVTVQEINMRYGNELLTHIHMWNGMKSSQYYYQHYGYTLSVNQENKPMTIAVLKYLISKGADYDIKDLKGKSLKMYCEEAKIWDEIMN